jgi:hypothetical protein
MKNDIKKFEDFNAEQVGGLEGTKDAVIDNESVKKIVESINTFIKDFNDKSTKLEQLNTTISNWRGDNNAKNDQFDEAFLDTKTSQEMITEIIAKLEKSKEVLEDYIKKEDNIYIKFVY